LKAATAAGKVRLQAWDRSGASTSGSNHDQVGRGNPTSDPGPDPRARDMRAGASSPARTASSRPINRRSPDGRADQRRDAVERSMVSRWAPVEPRAHPGLFQSCPASPVLFVVVHRERDEPGAQVVGPTMSDRASNTPMLRSLARRRPSAGHGRFSGRTPQARVGRLHRPTTAARLADSSRRARRDPAPRRGFPHDLGPARQNV